MRLIDADELIRKLETEKDQYDGVIREPGRFVTDKRSQCVFVIHLLKSAPTVECPDGWNPCESAKDLPPSGTTCLATVECSGEKHVIITQFDHGTGWSNLEYGERVIAWMKLPEMTDGRDCCENV